MDTFRTPAGHFQSRRRGLLLALTGGVVLSLFVSGTIVAQPLEGDVADPVRLISPDRRPQPQATLRLIDFKLRTTAGYQVLVSGS